MIDTEALKRIHAARLKWLHNSGMAVLLALLICLVFIAPAFISRGEIWRVVTDILVVFVLLSGVVAVLDHRRLAATLAVLSVLVIIERVAEGLVPAALLPVVR